MNIKLSKKSSVSVSRIFTLWMEKLNLSPGTVFMGTALAVGLLAGFAAVIFRDLIDLVEWVGFSVIPEATADWGMAYIIITPTLGGLMVGLLIHFFAREAKGHGVPEVMATVALHGGRIRARVAVVKALASSICIGFGGSVGREGPIVQIGASIGSTVGQVLGLSDNRIRNLVACGAASGIAATFNAPIAGVIFALEVILGQFSVQYFSTVVIAAVVASVIGRAMHGDYAAFYIPVEYGVNHAAEYVFYMLLGVLAGGVGAFFVKFLYASEDFFEKWKKIPGWLLPALGGAMLGVFALAYPHFTGVEWKEMPQVFNVGYGVIENALSGRIVLRAALALLVLKLIATSITIGTGGSGGVFAPSLFMGAMLGVGFGQALQYFFPGFTAPAGAYAVVGMGAFFAATAHAPMSAILIIFELTGDYRIILPLMLTVVTATVVAQKLLKDESIYTLKLLRRGVKLHHGQRDDIMVSVSVSDVMTRDVQTIQHSISIQEAEDVFVKTKRHGLPVLDDNNKLFGILTVSDIDRAFEKTVTRESLVSDACTQRSELLVTHPDENMKEALERMGRRGFGRLPVVSREDPNELVGLVRRTDIVNAYNLALYHWE